MSIDNNRDENGFIKLDNIIKDNLGMNNNRFVFLYNSKKYYFKKIGITNNIYNELIAEEIAKDYGLKCADYDLAKFNDTKGVISENFLKDDETYISMKTILINYYQVYKTKKNNLTDIISALEYKYRDPKLVGKLMDQIVDIFIFDILLANLDRHAENYGIIENGKDIKVSPVFDNTYMLADLTLMYGGYSLGVDEDDDFFSDDYEPDNKYLMKFLRYSSSEYVDLFKSKMWIISEENIEKILNRVEDKIHAKIDETIRNKIKVNFRINLDNINYVLEEVQERKL